MSHIIASSHRLPTSQIYMSVQKSYLHFCNTFSRIPVPATEQILLRIIAQISPSVGPQSIHLYLSAIRAMPWLPPTYTLYHRSHQRSPFPNTPPKQKTPFTFDILYSFLSVLPSDFDSLATWTCMTFTFFAFPQAGEITSSLPLEPGQSIPPVSHLSFSTTKLGQIFAQLFIPRTKTSQYSIKAIVGLTGNYVCAWCAMVKYLNSRYIINTSFVHTPLFMLSNHSFIHKQYLVSRTSSLMSSICLNPANFTGHSFWVGAATQASINHMPEFHILGRWKSNAYKTYIHTPIEQIANYSNVLSNS